MSAAVTDNVQSAAYQSQVQSVLGMLQTVFSNIISASQKIVDLESVVASATTDLSNGKQALSTKLGIDTSSGLPTFSIINQQIDQTRTDYYNSGVTDADNRALPGTVNYDTGWNDGKTWADNRAQSGTVNYDTGWNDGKTWADNRADSSTANWQNGYSTGWSDADNRSEPNSYNYKSGYEAGLIAGKSEGVTDFMNKGLINPLRLELTKGQLIPCSLKLDGDYLTLIVNFPSSARRVESGATGGSSALAGSYKVYDQRSGSLGEYYAYTYYGGSLTGYTNQNCTYNLQAIGYSAGVGVTGFGAYNNIIAFDVQDLFYSGSIYCTATGTKHSASLGRYGDTLWCSDAFFGDFTMRLASYTSWGTLHYFPSEWENLGYNTSNGIEFYNDKLFWECPEDICMYAFRQ